MRTWLLLPLVAALAACNTATARQHAAVDLDCPIDAIQSTNLGETAGEASWVTYQETGCGGVAFYTCYARGGDCSLDTTEPTRVFGDLRVDGVPFVPGGRDACDTGYADGFFGVEIGDAAGDSLHLIEDPVSGADTAVYLDRSGVRSRAFDACVSLTLDARPVVNGRDAQATFITGHATLDCDGDGSSLAGQLAFQVCGAASRF